MHAALITDKGNNKL